MVRFGETDREARLSWLLPSVLLATGPDPLGSGTAQLVRLLGRKFSAEHHRCAAPAAHNDLTNVARHADATQVEISLRHSEGVVGLRIRDDGRGLGLAHEGAGIRGMRERALLVGATLDLGASPTGGAEVNLLVPLNRKGA